ncbi:MAG TPA: hypothetical protein V6D19_04625, partial [Stenomitos sp.]
MSKMKFLKPLIYVLTVATSTSTVIPVGAQANSYHITCQTTVSLNQDVRLSYRLVGKLSETSTTKVPPNPIPAALTLTVQLQNKNGQFQTLLNASELKDYEQLAPDAEYSQLPFETPFRGQSNNGDRLYGTPTSVHGLYVSLRPASGYPRQIQTIHYLHPNQYVRSTVGTCQTEN